MPSSNFSEKQESCKMSCCVPRCINVAREWTSDFPRDEELLARWKAAIQVGTGQFLPAGSDPKGGPVCNMHFRVKTTDASTNSKYREPSLFFRDNVLLEVSWCRLCSRYEVIDNMLDMEDCLQQGNALQWMAKKYSASTQLGKEDVFFCEKCIFRVSKTDEFEQEIRYSARKHELLLLKIAKEELTVKSVSSVRIESPTNNDYQSNSKECSEKELNETAILEEIVIKKEPQFEEMSAPDSSKSLPDTVTSAKDIVVKQEPALSQTVERPESFTIEYLKDPGETPEDVIVKEEPQLVEVDDPSSKTGYKCKFCDASYRMQHELVLHIKTSHPNAASIRKHQNQWVCHTQTGGKKRVRRTNGHQQVASRLGGESRKETVCLLCKELFQQSKDIITHFKELHADTDLRYYPCPLCDEVYFSASSIRTHVYVHDDVYNCDLCGKNLRSNDALVNHRYTFHGVPLSENRFVVCPACNQKFKRYNFNKHGRTCKGKVREFGCDRCDKLFTVRRELREHKKSHTEANPLECYGCGKKYSKSQSLNTHKYVCKGKIGEKPCICSECGKGYSNAASLASHKRVCKCMVVKKPLICCGCGKRYRNPGSLCSHERECAYVVKDGEIYKASDDSVAGRLSRKRKRCDSNADSDLINMEPLEPYKVNEDLTSETDLPIVKMEPNEPQIEEEGVIFEAENQLNKVVQKHDESAGNKCTNESVLSSKGEKEILVWMPR